MRAGNSASDEMKIRWLSELDSIIYNEVILTHEVEHSEFREYENASDELIAKAPYDIMYVYWLMAQIDLKASELNRYNNSLALFNSEYKRYKAWFNRTFMPKAKKQIKLCIDGGM